MNWSIFFPLILIKKVMRYCGSLSAALVVRIHDLDVLASNKCVIYIRVYNLRK